MKISEGFPDGYYSDLAKEWLRLGTEIRGAWPHARQIPAWNWHCCPLYRAGNQAGAVLRYW